MSLPCPLCLYPPCGISGVSGMCVLIHTVPHFSFRAALRARPMSRASLVQSPSLTPLVGRRLKAIPLREGVAIRNAQAERGLCTPRTKGGKEERDCYARRDLRKSDLPPARRAARGAARRAARRAEGAAHRRR